MEHTETENPNVYGSFRGKKIVIVKAFVKRGWSSRKCSWTDFEIENEWSELIVEGYEPDCLINGFVLDVENNISKISDVLKSTVSNWKLEIYDTQSQLVKELKKKA